MTARDDIASFAALLAELESPFAMRRAALADHGLTPEAFEAVRRRWAEVLRSDDGKLRSRFESAYSAMSAALASAQRRNAGSASSGRGGALELPDTERLPGTPEELETVEFRAVPRRHADALPFHAAIDDAPSDADTLPMPAVRAGTRIA